MPPPRPPDDTGCLPAALEEEALAFTHRMTDQLGKAWQRLQEKERALGLREAGIAEREAEFEASSATDRVKVEELRQTVIDEQERVTLEHNLQIQKAEEALQQQALEKREAELTALEQKVAAEWGEAQAARSAAEAKLAEHTALLRSVQEEAADERQRLDLRVEEVQRIIAELKRLKRELAGAPAGALGERSSFIPPRMRKACVEGRELVLSAGRRKAFHDGDHVVRAVADLTTNLKEDDETSLCLCYHRGEVEGVAPAVLKASRPAIVLYCGKEAAAKVCIPVDVPDEPQALVCMVDLKGHVLSLLQDDMLLTRDAMWATCSLNAPSSAFTLGLALYYPASCAEIVDPPCARRP